MDLCANCKMPYSAHVQPTTQCQPGSVAKWFPKPIADALTRQRRKIRKAQRELAARQQDKLEFDQ